MLRLCLAVSLLYFATGGLANPTETIAFAQDMVGAAGAIFLLAGLWTPVIGTLVALDEGWIGLSHYASAREDTWTHICLAILALSVAMLGPGAWSIDARLFGRRRFDIDRSRGKHPSK